MHLRTLLKQYLDHPGFVFENEHLEDYGGKPALDFEVRPRKNGKAICSGCEKPAPGYDSLTHRLFQFVPFWGFLVFFRYAMRRVECSRCGVKDNNVNKSFAYCGS